MSKICPKCGSIRIVETLKGDASICLACESFFDTIDGKSKQTLFDRITASPEVLAPCFVEKQPDQWDDDDYAYYSYLTKEWYATEDKAIAATVAKLKEVCDE